MGEAYEVMVEALDAVWRRWAEVGVGVSPEQWRAGSRCAGWDVAALYGHHGQFPLALAAPAPPVAGPGVPVLTAVEVLRGFNAAGGVAVTMAEAVAAEAVAAARAATAEELLARFREVAPVAVRNLRAADGDTPVLWPASAGAVPLVEGLRIVVMEATVHLLDVCDALHVAPEVPAEAMGATVRLLAEVAPPVAFVEYLTGRNAHDPFPVLR